jgi:hypothetical protein
MDFKSLKDNINKILNEETNKNDLNKEEYKEDIKP